MEILILYSLQRLSSYQITDGMGSLDTDFIAPFLWNHAELLKANGVYEESGL